MSEKVRVRASVAMLSGMAWVCEECGGPFALHDVVGVDAFDGEGTSRVPWCRYCFGWRFAVVKLLQVFSWGMRAKWLSAEVLPFEKNEDRLPRSTDKENAG